MWEEGAEGTQCAETDLWRQLLGHPGRTALEGLHSEDMVKGIETGLYRCIDYPTYCDACARGKQTKLPFAKRTSAPSL
jgi:hypothetical protein